MTEDELVELISDLLEKQFKAGKEYFRWENLEKDTVYVEGSVDIRALAAGIRERL